MTPQSEHVIDDLLARLDGTLPAPDEARVAAHLAACETCGRAWQEMQALRAAVRRIPPEAVPDRLAARIAADLDAASSADVPARSPWRWAWAAAAAAAVVLLVLWATTGRSAPDVVARDYAGLQRGGLALEQRTGDIAALESWFAARQLRFPARVLDLAMMQWRLEGGRVHDVAGRRSALFAYRNPDGRWLLCEMYAGDLEDLPPAADVRQRGGITFRVYREGSSTLVFWEEGEVLCVLVSDIPYEEVVQLAFAKAMLAVR